MRFKLVRPPERTVDGLLVFSVLALALVLGVAVVARIPRRIMPPGVCVFHRVTGYPCLTCGGTRTAIALGDLDVPAAFRWNPLVAATLALAVLFGPLGMAAWLFKWPRPRLENVSRGEKWALSLAAGALVLANWAYLIITKV